MSAVLENPAVMIRKGAPHIIHSDKQLKEYTEHLLTLSAKAHPNRAEEEAIELLTLLVERYEEEHYPIPDASPAEVLQFLIDQNGLLQRDLIPELGNEATVSLVLSGKRSLTIDHIVKLCQRFRVSAAAFFPSPEAKQLIR